MTAAHPTHFIVTAMRNNTVVHMERAETLATAQDLKTRFEQAPHTVADISEVHERAETDLTTHTRELLESLQE